MPNLKEVRESGTSGVLESTVPPASLPAWPSMVTGQNPGKHGIFDLGGPLGVADPWPVYDLGPWHILEDQTLCFINVPGTYPLVEKGIDGYVVSGMFTPTNDWEEFDEFVYPESFADELEDVVDDYYIDIWVLKEEKMPERASEAARNRATVINHVLDEKDVDLLWAVFTAPDRLMHKFLAYHDEDHPIYDSVPEDSPKRDVLREHFRQLDDHLGDIRERLDEDDYLFVLSDHGFQPTYLNLDLKELLAGHGYLEKEEDTTKSLAARLGFHTENLERIFRFFGGEKLLEIGSKQFRMWLKHIRNRLLPSPGPNVTVDRSESTVTIGSSGHTIQVNTVSQGGPVPDAERKAVRDDIIADLEQFQDEHDLEGTVMATDEVWHGPKVDEIPDVYWFFETVEDSGCSGENILSPFDEVYDGSVRTGSAWHHPDGIYAAQGPGIEQGEVDSTLYDVVPTLTYLLAGTVPAEADGTVMNCIGDASDATTVSIGTDGGEADIDGIDI